MESLDTAPAIDHPTDDLNERPEYSDVHNKPSCTLHQIEYRLLENNWDACAAAHFDFIAIMIQQLIKIGCDNMTGI